MLRTKSTKATSKILRKYGNKISINNSNIKGTFTVKNYRKYNFHSEVDIVFEGEIFVNYLGKKTWYPSSIMDDRKFNGGRRVSKIKVNRFIRKNMFFDVKTYLKYFDVDISYYDLIKKISWL